MPLSIVVFPKSSSSISRAFVILCNVEVISYFNQNAHLRLIQAVLMGFIASVTPSFITRLIAHDIHPVKRNRDNNRIFPEFIGISSIALRDNRHSSARFLTDMQLQENFRQLLIKQASTYGKTSDLYKPAP